MLFLCENIKSLGKVDIYQKITLYHSEVSLIHLTFNYATDRIIVYYNTISLYRIKVTECKRKDRIGNE